MTSSDADGPLDNIDLETLDDIREIFQASDPMPTDLPERIRFSLALRSLEIEVARLAEDEADGPLLAVRGAEHSRTITFDSTSLTIMIRIDANEDGTARVDGWLAPPQPCDIEMKTGKASLNVTSDEQGRFAFVNVPRGTAQLIVKPAGQGRPVVTPALILLPATLGGARRNAQRRAALSPLRQLARPRREPGPRGA
jgi:hypothetical protein